jgi:hypothetical protein
MAKLIARTFLVLMAAAVCSCSRPIENQTTAQAGASPTMQTRASEGVQNSYADVPEKTPFMHRSQAGEPGPDGWCLAESTRGGFSVMLPGKFDDSLLKMATTTGGVSVFHSVATKTADGADFNAAYIEVIGVRPPESESMVQVMVERFKNLGGTVSKRDVVLSGSPGEQLHVEAQGTTAEMVILKTPTGDYMLAVQTFGSIGADLQKAIDRFLKSFKITKIAR